MHNSQTKEARFAQARAEKRQIFQENWNAFLKQPALRISLLAYLASQLVIFLVSGMTIRDIAFGIQILHEGYPAWCNFVIFGLQLLLAVPGAMVLSMEMLMALYYGFLRKTYAAHEQINDALAAQLQDPYDPYNNHN